MNDTIIYDFGATDNFGKWRVEDDTVMGGRSQGNLSLNDEGHAVFEGNVSLANNGGFSSINYDFETKTVSDAEYVAIKLKGDGKDYQFRVKSELSEYYSYVQDFKTTGDWQTIKLPFNNFKPQFRGRKLDMPNYPGKELSRVGILIGNKKEQDFKLLIDRIWVE